MKLKTHMRVNKKEMCKYEAECTRVQTGGLQNCSAF